MNKYYYKMMSYLTVLTCAIVLSMPTHAMTVLVDGEDGTTDAGGCGTPNNPCNTIQKGVDVADPGDTVEIAKGIYLEHVIIPEGNDNLTVIGDVTKGKVKMLRVTIDPQRLTPPAHCDGDSSRTIFAGGPNTGACRDINNQTACEAAWHIGGAGAASCYWTGFNCQGCGPNNENNNQCTNTCTGPNDRGIEVSADYVTIESVKIRNGITQGMLVNEVAQGTIIKKVEISGPDSACITVFGPNTTIEDSQLGVCGEEGINNGFGNQDNVNPVENLTIRGITVAQADEGVLIRNAKNLSISDSEFFIIDSDCIDVDGDGIIIQNNAMHLCDGEGVESDGTNMVITHNHTHGTDGEGFDISCSALTCNSDPSRTIFAGGPNTSACRDINNQTDCEAAWHIGGSGAASCYWTGASCEGCGPNNESQGNCTNTCTDPVNCTVSNNVVDGTSFGECFEFDGRGILAEHNVATDCEDNAFELDGNDHILRYNEARDSGSDRNDDAYDIQGTNHTLEYNTSLRAADDGYGIEGTGHVLQYNEATASGEDGFDVGNRDEFANTTENITLVGNTAEKNNAMGIEVSAHAVNTTLTNNNADENRIDFCDAGTGTTETGGTFGTTDLIACYID